MNRLVLLFAVLICVPATAKPAAEDIYGPPPAWDRYKQLGEAAIRAQVADPNIIIEWPNGYMRSGWRHKGRFPGYLTCGRFRASAPQTGSYGVTNFAIVIDHDAVQRLDISTREHNSLVNVICGAIAQRGFLPPASMMETSNVTEIASLGLTIHAVPKGAYVVAVDPVGLAAQATLKPGMVLTQANGIPLAGLGAAVPKVLAGDTPTLTLVTAAGDHIELRRRR